MIGANRSGEGTGRGLWPWWVALVQLLLLGGCAGRAHETVEAGDEGSEQRVLVAVEVSEFKEAVATRLLDELGAAGYYVKLVGLDGLNEEPVDGYGAIVLINALQMMHLDGAVRDFFDDLDEEACRRVVLVTTTSHEDWSFFHEEPVERGVDAITAASKQANVGPVSEKVIARIEALGGG